MENHAMVRELTIISATALIIASLAAHAQSTPGQLTYRCVGKDGKKYYGSTVPTPCLGLPIEQLNTSGMVVKRINPEGDEKERAAKEKDIDTINARYDQDKQRYLELTGRR